MKLRFNELGIDKICGLFNKSRQSYYAMCRRTDSHTVEYELILDCIKRHRELMPKIGTRKLLVLIKPELDAHGIKCGRDKLFSILRQSGHLNKRKKRCVGITKREPISRHFVNLIKGLDINKPEMVWATDTTEVKASDGTAYIKFMTDMYSKKIMGYACEDNKGSTSSIATLKMALKNRLYPSQSLIHHSDGGSEFFNYEYMNLLLKRQIRISCSAPGCPKENPVAERINGILKQEFLYERKKYTISQVRNVLHEIVKIYNHNRPHMSLNNLTPEVAHMRTGHIKKIWRAYAPTVRRTGNPESIGKIISEIMAKW